MDERRREMEAQGGYLYPDSQTPWQEMQRGTRRANVDGAVIEPAVKYQRIGQASAFRDTTTKRPYVRFRPIADIKLNLQCERMTGKRSFAERVGRSFRSKMWGKGALVVLAALLLLLAEFGGQSEAVLWLGAALGIGFLVWIALVLKWSQTKFLRRAGWRRRRADEAASTDQA